MTPDELNRSIASAQGKIGELQADKAKFEHDLQVLKQARSRSSSEQVSFTEGLGSRRSTVAAIGQIGNVQQAQNFKDAMDEAFGSSFESGVLGAFGELNAALDSRIAEAEQRLQDIASQIGKAQDGIDQAQDELRREAARQQAESQAK